MGKKSKRRSNRHNGGKQPKSLVEEPIPPATATPAAALASSSAPASSLTGAASAAPPQEQPPTTAQQAPQTSDLSSTKLAEESYCIACGASNAPMLCQCGQVSFCGASCAKTAWADHRLLCPAKAEKERKNGARFLSGDIVKIHGLAGASGLQYNDCLAEVQSYCKEKHRYVIMFSTKKTSKIKSVLAKRENLELHLGVERAANAAHEWDVKNPDSYREVGYTVDHVRELHKYVLKPHLFVHQLENHNPVCIWGTHFNEDLLGKQGHPKLYKKYLECGLASVLFKDFSFPLAIDTRAVEVFFEPNEKQHDFFPGVDILTTCLRKARSQSTQFELSKFVKEIIHAMGPYILIMCSKKRRLLGSLNTWCAYQSDFIELLSFCCVAPEAFTESIYSLPKECWTSLMEHLVLLATVDHKKFLQNCASYSAERTVSANSISPGISTLMSLMVHAESAESAKIKHFGLIPVPFGARYYIGCSFASVAPKVFARMILNFTFYDPEYFQQYGLNLALQTTTVCKAFHRTSSLDSETGEANGYTLENMQQLDSWEQYVDRSARLLESEDNN